MHIKHVGQTMIMSEGIVCSNYGDMNHGLVIFSKVGDNQYSCSVCGAILTIKEPVLVLDEKGRLKIQVEVGTGHEQTTEDC